jgi:hypothetical protein
MKFILREKYIIRDKKTKEVMKVKFVSEDEDYLFFNYIRRPFPYKSADIIIAKELRKNFTIKKITAKDTDDSDLVDRFDNLKINKPKKKDLSDTITNLKL